MNAGIYDIPASLIPGFHERKKIVRAHDPAEIAKNTADKDLEDISFVRLLSLHGNLDSLMGWGHAIPIELVVSDTCRDLPLLYRYTPLLADHPIRVSVPLVTGFGSVVKFLWTLRSSSKADSPTSR
jgi:hypothetical protein